MMHLGLTGWPVAHSLSPRLHNAALHSAGIDGEYSLYPVEPAQPKALADLLARLRAGELRGLNVTIPHKQTVLALLDDLSDSARAIGAVNTIYMDSGRLMGHNTDAPGFLADVRKTLFKTDNFWANGQALVLGAGGSARAVAWALMHSGWQVTIAARRLDQAMTLAASLASAPGVPAPECVLLDSGGLSSSLDDTRLVVNTTSVGMTPQVDFSPWPVGLSFPEQAVVYDLVYNPSETLLVRQVRSAGLFASTGLGMLVEQAALGFEIWTGCPAPRATMFSALEA